MRECGDGGICGKCLSFFNGGKLEWSLGCFLQLRLMFFKFEAGKLSFFEENSPAFWFDLSPLRLSKPRAGTDRPGPSMNHL